MPNAWDTRNKNEMVDDEQRSFCKRSNATKQSRHFDELIANGVALGISGIHNSTSSVNFLCYRNRIQWSRTAILSETCMVLVSLHFNQETSESKSLSGPVILKDSGTVTQPQPNRTIETSAVAKGYGASSYQPTFSETELQISFRVFSCPNFKFREAEFVPN
mmetsp:Transcript_41743/g.100158  ORF Transcript_41743/g.100158 Transcript_41743/m.100158 type:complete len:162 (+) Transcript_41743:353-838(+)